MKSFILNPKMPFDKPKGTSTDWGAFPANDTPTFDHRIAAWAIELPNYIENDWSDIPQIAAQITDLEMMPEMEWMLKENRWEEAVKAYLASVYFVDHQIGTSSTIMMDQRSYMILIKTKMNILT